MATKKTEEVEVKKTVKKAPCKKSEPKATKKEEVKVEDNSSLKADFENLQSELEKVKAELSIIKQFKNSSEKNSSDKIFQELEKLKEILYGLEDRVEELEYQISEKEDY